MYLELRDVDVAYDRVLALKGVSISAERGEIVALGTPEDVVKVKRSYTGQFLAPVLARKEARRGKKRLTITAKPGDTLAKLGRRYGLSPGDLARINRFSYNTELHEGDVLEVVHFVGGG